MNTRDIAISCVILAKNEEKNIVRAIRSVLFCDEIILVDDYSQDSTVEKASQFDVPIKIFKKKLNSDFSAQRNFGMKKARGEWILFIDADEEITEELKHEILRTKSEIYSKSQNEKGKQIATYYIKRRDIFWGRVIHFGETGRTKIARLIRKHSGEWRGKVHEIYRTNGRIGIFKNDLIHRPHPTIKDFLSEINYYSSIRAKELSYQNIKTNIFEIIFYPFGKFIFNYFLRGGFLDSSAGFVYAFMMSFHSFLVRTKLYLLCHKK